MSAATGLPGSASPRLARRAPRPHLPPGRADPPARLGPRAGSSSARHGSPRAGLADHARAPAAAAGLWFATEAGIDAVAPPGRLRTARPPLLDEQVRGVLSAHTLAVNEAAIAFLRAARERGEEFGPLSWRHEVAHPLRPGARGRRARAVIADALLTYLRLTEEDVPARAALPRG